MEITFGSINIYHLSFWVLNIKARFKKLVHDLGTFKKIILNH